MASPVFFQALQLLEATYLLVSCPTRLNLCFSSQITKKYCTVKCRQPVHKEDGGRGGKQDEPEPQEDVDLKIFSF